jgi:hypothetical protein
MGLLDDAIREHLDLKRRRGADPAEVERAEHEALGPVRRGREEPADPEPSYEPDADRGAAYNQESDYDQEDEQGWGDELTEDEPETPKKGARKFFQRRSRQAAEPEFLEEPLGEPEPTESHEPTGFVEPEIDDEPQAPPSPRARPRGSAPRQTRGEEPAAPESQRAATPPPSGPAEGETVEYDVEGALDEHTQEGDDVLEETPEFLQDTPEHDRLWFEQRPPRDFDFEG